KLDQSLVTWLLSSAGAADPVLGDTGRRPGRYRDELRPLPHQYFAMKRIATDAQVLVDPAVRQRHLRFLEKLVHAPANRNAHTFGVTRGYGSDHRIPNQTSQHVFDFFFEQFSNAQSVFHPTGVDVSVWPPRAFRAAVTVLKEIQPARPTITEVVG